MGVDFQTKNSLDVHDYQLRQRIAQSFLSQLALEMITATKRKFEKEHTLIPDSMTPTVSKPGNRHTRIVQASRTYSTTPAAMESDREYDVSCNKPTPGIPVPGLIF